MLTIHIKKTDESYKLTLSDGTVSETFNCLSRKDLLKLVDGVTRQCMDEDYDDNGFYLGK